MLRRRWSVLNIALLSFFAVVPLLAQTAASKSSDVAAPTFRVNARSVVVDVVVTDKSGKAVIGLPGGSFQVFEDGKPQGITFFEQHGGTATGGQSETATPEPAPLPPNTFTNVPAGVPTSSVNVLLMDALNTPMVNQVYVHQQMVKYLAGIPPGIRIAVFLLSDRLRIVQGFTEDSSALRAAIARSAANPRQSALLPTSADANLTNTAVGAIASMGPAGNAQSAASAAALQAFMSEQASFETNMRVEESLSALQDMARYLAGVPGRKNLIWFAGSIPLCVFAKDTLECPYYDKVKKTLDMLSNAQVSVYPIEASALAPDSHYDIGDAPITAAVQAKQAQGMVASQATTAIQNESLQGEASGRNSTHLVMDELAKATGGKASYNQNGLNETLAEDIDNGARYYSLAYTPTNLRASGKQRKIEVKVTSGKYSLAYRRGYIEDTPKELRVAEAAQVKDPLRPLMDRGMPNFTELSYRMSVAPASSQPAADAARAGSNANLKAPFTRYGIDFLLAIDGLDLASAQDGVRRGKIEVALVAYDRDGKPLNWAVKFMGLAIKPEQFEMAQKSGIPFHLDIDAPPGDIYLRTGIFDTSSSKAGTLEIPLSAVKRSNL